MAPQTQTFDSTCRLDSKTRLKRRLLRKRNLPSDRSSPSPESGGVAISWFVLSSSVSNWALPSSLLQYQSVSHKRSLRQGTGPLAPPPPNHRDVGSFINTVWTLNKGILFVCLVWFIFLSSLRSLQIFICYFLYCIFCTITVNSMSFA